jgi:hypothetical protein
MGVALYSISKNKARIFTYAEALGLGGALHGMETKGSAIPLSGVQCKGKLT